MHGTPSFEGLPSRKIHYAQTCARTLIPPFTNSSLGLGMAIRRGKLNSQFIVTRFSILHAGGRSLFRFHISPTATFSMIARDKKTHKTVFTSLQGPEEVIKELLGSTVTTDHGIMQRLLPVTWTDTNVRPYGRTVPGLRPLLQGQ